MPSQRPMFAAIADRCAPTGQNLNVTAPVWVDPESGSTCQLFKALIGIFSQTARSTCDFWVNPVNSTLVCRTGSGHSQWPWTFLDTRGILSCSAERDEPRLLMTAAVICSRT
jgi:hypothetical protein